MGGQEAPIRERGRAGRKGAGEGEEGMMEELGRHMAADVDGRAVAVEGVPCFVSWPAGDERTLHQRPGPVATRLNASCSRHVAARGPWCCAPNS